MDLNRSEPVPAWRCAGLVIDVQRRVVLRDGRACALGGRAFDLLVALVERHDRVVSKHELIDLVWPHNVVEENNLQVHISALRKLVGADAIATVPGRGYQFTAPLNAAGAGEGWAWRYHPRTAVPVLRPRFCVYVAMSLDGFIAREDGRVDWLAEASSRVPPGEDCGYSAFMEEADLLVMGRRTFEQVLALTPWPHGGTPVHVLSTTLRCLPPGLPPTVTLSSEAPAALAVRLQQQGLQRVYLDGGVTVQRFLGDDLVDEVIVTTIPILLGRGRPLFGAMQRDVQLVHVRTRTWPFGFVQSTYRRA
jgi:DNA-binding winged helix-turn-helix (wHTH) protein/dihydrofolate reductase